MTTSRMDGVAFALVLLLTAGTRAQDAK